MKKIGIIGGGISGLYFANILNNHKDYEYKIYEKLKNPRVDVGYGIQLSVNSIKLLNKIGFKNIPASDLSFPTKINFFNLNNNEKISEIDLKQFNDNQNRYTTLKRSTLLKFLIQNIPESKIKYNVTLKNVENSNIIKANFSDNSSENFDYLIVTDGALSNSRSLVAENEILPKFNNCLALRANLKQNTNHDISIFMGPKFHYVVYPVNQKNDFNFVAIFKKKLSKSELNNHNIYQSENFLSFFKKILNSYSDIKFENLEETKVFPIFISNKIPISKYKNIYMSGDALFTFPPSFAQGASQSIETANDIFQCINNNSKKKYQIRLKKILSVNWRSKLNSFAFQVSNPMLIFLRNFLFKRLLKSKLFLNYYIGKIYNE